jgi:hypothetical protein
MAQSNCVPSSLSYMPRDNRLLDGLPYFRLCQLSRRSPSLDLAHIAALLSNHDCVRSQFLFAYRYAINTFLLHGEVLYTHPLTKERLPIERLPTQCTPRITPIISLPYSRLAGSVCSHGGRTHLHPGKPQSSFREFVMVLSHGSWLMSHSDNMERIVTAFEQKRLSGPHCMRGPTFIAARAKNNASLRWN